MLPLCHRPPHPPRPTPFQTLKDKHEPNGTTACSAMCKSTFKIITEKNLTLSQKSSDELPWLTNFIGSAVDRASVPSPITIDIQMVHNGEGQSSHILVFSVNFERHIATHITISIKCYLNSLTYVYVPFTNI